MRTKRSLPGCLTIFAVLLACMVQATWAANAESGAAPAPLAAVANNLNPEPTVRDGRLSELESIIAAHRSTTRKYALELENIENISAFHQLLRQIEMDVYNYQLVMSKIVTSVVVVLVIGGFFLAFRQFELDKAKIENNQAGATVPTTFKLGRDGLEISSSIIGLIILAISLGFFYVYIKEVYPVNINSIDALSFNNGGNSAEGSNTQTGSNSQD